MLDLMEHTAVYLEYCRLQKRLDPKTLKAYSIDLTQLRAFLAQEQAQLDKAGLTAFLGHLNARYRPKTVKRKLACARAYCSWLEYMELLPYSPFSGLRLSFREPFLLPRTIPLELVQAILDAAYRNFALNADRLILRDIALLELMFATGARISELCSLAPGDVLVDGTIKIYGKGSRERIIQLGTPDVLIALDRYAAAFHSTMADAGAYFVNRFGNRFSEQSARRMLEKYTRLAGSAEHVTPHMFRHTFATLLLEEDVDIRYIQSLLGHSSITTTQIYTHVAAAKQRAILQLKHPRNKLHIGFPV